MRIGIIGAMDVEVAHFKENMKIEQTMTVAGQEYCLGKIGNTEAVVVQCGIGKVRSAMSVQVLNDLFHVTHIINTGIAGSLNNDIHIGDIVVSNDAVFHDVEATNFGYALGEVPGVGTLFFHADQQLHDLAVTAIKQVAQDIHPFEGRIATGDQFICTKDKKEWIRENFHADCCEMEGASIAEACYLNKIPFVIVRAISDQADESVVESYDVFEGKAAEHCAKLVFYMLEHMNA